MPESHHHHHHQHQHQHHPPPPVRAAVRSSGGGEIVEVQGGHIVRSTGRKDRHSKVCTAKGPRDRRVRLSAHTAIKFYDVQDRLGYDRPSKAVDWLIKNAKPAIDELDELPPWQPSAGSEPQETHPRAVADPPEAQLSRDRDSGKKPVESTEPALNTAVATASFGFQHLTTSVSGGGGSSGGFLPPALDSDVIADTIKTFFPMGSGSSSTSSSMHFQTYPPDLLSRTSSQAQDLRLSLQSFQDPMMIHHQQHQHQHQQELSTPGEQGLFAAHASLSFDPGSAAWSEPQNQQELSRFHRMIAWNSAENAGSGAGGNFVFSTPIPVPLFGQSPVFTQRGPLQSSNSPAIRAWADSPLISAAEHPATIHQPSSISAVGFASGGFSGFHIPARIQGEDEHDAAADGTKPSNNASSSRRH